jgi:hypothetical protein
LLADDVCEPILACADIGCAGLSRLCEFDPLGSTDATCGECLPGFEGEANTSLECTELEVFSCASGEPGAVECESLNRECEDSITQGCTGCLSGFLQHPDDPGGACEEYVYCDERDCDLWNRSCEHTLWGQSTCGDCLEGSNEPTGAWDPADIDPNVEAFSCLRETTCIESDALRDFVACADNEQCNEETRQCYETTAADCLAGEAFNPNTSQCVACFGCSADHIGETGECTIAASQVVCETSAGFYLSDSTNAAICDADSDGWLNTSAATAYYQQGTSSNFLEAAQYQQFRCSFRFVDEVLLVSDSYVSGGYLQRSIPLDVAIPLFEDDTQDSDTRLATSGSGNPGDKIPLASNNPEFGAQGMSGTGVRLFSAKQMNPMTKVCWSPDTDLNFNSLRDFEEATASEMSGFTDFNAPSNNNTLENVRSFYNAFSYFVELHDAYFEYESGGIPIEVGRYVIREKHRTDSSFPFNYYAWEAG